MKTNFPLLIILLLIFQIAFGLAGCDCSDEEDDDGEKYEHDPRGTLDVEEFFIDGCEDYPLTGMRGGGFLPSDGFPDCNPYQERAPFFEFVFSYNKMNKFSSTYDLQIAPCTILLEGADLQIECPEWNLQGQWTYPTGGFPFYDGQSVQVAFEYEYEDIGPLYLELWVLDDQGETQLIQYSYIKQFEDNYIATAGAVTCEYTDLKTAPPPEQDYFIWDWVYASGIVGKLNDDCFIIEQPGEPVQFAGGKLLAYLPTAFYGSILNIEYGEDTAPGGDYIFQIIRNWE